MQKKKRKVLRLIRFGALVEAGLQNKENFKKKVI